MSSHPKKHPDSLSSRKSKQSNKTNRSVSWGFEEIYEAPEQVGNIDQSVGSEKDPADRAVLSAIAAAAAGTAVAKGLDNETIDMTQMEEQNLFARTLELSRGLFASLTTQDLKDTDDEEVFKSLFNFGIESNMVPTENKEVSKKSSPFDNCLVQVPVSSTSQSGTSQCSPIDVEKLFDTHDKLGGNRLERNPPITTRDTGYLKKQENSSFAGNLKTELQNTSKTK